MTRPEAPSADDVAALFAELGGRPVQALAADDDAVAAGLVDHARTPEPVAQGYATLGLGVRRGVLGRRQRRRA